jgi:hypothetical protein
MGVDSRGRKRRQIHKRAEKVGTCFSLHFILFRSRDRDDRYVKRLRINPLVKRCGINPALQPFVISL